MNALRDYFRETSRPVYTAAMVLPFLLFYHLGLVLLRADVVNAADELIRRNFLVARFVRFSGLWSSFASLVVLAVCFFIWERRVKGGRRYELRLVFALLGESFFYAVGLFMMMMFLVVPAFRETPVTSAASAASVPIAETVYPASVSRSERDGATTADDFPPTAAAAVKAGAKENGQGGGGGGGVPAPEMQRKLLDFVLFCGAGIYEELVFRVFLLGLLILTFTELFHMEKAYAAAWAVVCGAVLFSLFHYLGPEGDYWRWSGFFQRFFAGVFFAVLYVVRGFGVAAATHTLYDFMVGLWVLGVAG